LEVWKLAIEIAKQCYVVTRGFPKEELFGMTSQIRRAAASVPANVAEGYGRDSKGEYVQFLRVSQGSLKELETHLILSREVGIVDSARVERILSDCERLGKMLRSLVRAIQRSPAN
jgi:four helix bundle protein